MENWPGYCARKKKLRRRQHQLFHIFKTKLKERARNIWELRIIIVMNHVSQYDEAHIWRITAAGGAGFVQKSN